MDKFKHSQCTNPKNPFAPCARTDIEGTPELASRRHSSLAEPGSHGNKTTPPRVMKIVAGLFFAFNTRLTVNVDAPLIASPTCPKAARQMTTISRTSNCTHGVTHPKANETAGVQGLMAGNLEYRLMLGRDGQ